MAFYAKEAALFKMNVILKHEVAIRIIMLIAYCFKYATLPTIDSQNDVIVLFK